MSDERAADLAVALKHIGRDLATQVAIAAR
jgi:hypothetical protein